MQINASSSTPIAMLTTTPPHPPHHPHIHHHHHHPSRLHASKQSISTTASAPARSLLHLDCRCSRNPPVARDTMLSRSTVMYVFLISDVSISNGEAYDELLLMTSLATPGTTGILVRFISHHSFLVFPYRSHILSPHRIYSKSRRSITPSIRATANTAYSHALPSVVMTQTVRNITNLPEKARFPNA